MKQKNTSYFLTTPRAPHVSPPHDDELEFHESDVVWSHNHEFTATATATVTPYISSPRGYTTGISASLLSDNQPRSPTSIQRKTTSSPVSMISSSYISRSGGGGPVFGPLSAPVNVPVWPNNKPNNKADEDEDEEEEGKMVPPHEMVAKSYNTTSFSVFEGAGRTLKGRDLTKLRNSVLIKTGFLD